MIVTPGSPLLGSAAASCVLVAAARAGWRSRRGDGRVSTGTLQELRSSCIFQIVQKNLRRCGKTRTKIDSSVEPVLTWSI